MIQPVPQNGQPQLIALANIQTRAQIRTRNGFDAVSLGELAESMKIHGVLQPIAVTTADANGMHTLIMGERRMLAASMAGFTDIPATIREGTTADHAAAQAVENLQREDLHLADVSDAMAALFAVHGSWRDVARAIGKSPAWVSKRRALARLRPITAQVMREGWTADPEILLTLNQIEGKDKDKAESLASQLEAGTISREAIRAALNYKPAPTSDDGDGEGEGDADGEGNGEAPKDKKASLRLTQVHAEMLLACAKQAVKYPTSGGMGVEATAMAALLAEFVAKHWTE